MAPPTASEGEERRVEELLRVNAALAAEVRSLSQGRIEAPRSAAMPAARRIGALLEERDKALADLDATRVRLAQVESWRDELECQHTALAAEVSRLRGGLRGLLRRARARLLRS